MRKAATYWIIIVILCGCIIGCMSTVMTGASVFYERHHWYKKISDFQLAALSMRRLYKDTVFKRPDCVIDLAVFNGDLLLAGYVPNQAMRAEVERRTGSPHYRRIFNQITPHPMQNHNLSDAWITTQIRTQIIGDAKINPDDFKIVTSDGIVYIMGDVKPSQAKRVIDIARNVPEVRRVVTLMLYYHLSSKH